MTCTIAGVVLAGTLPFRLKAQSQSIRIEVVDGKTGRDVPHQRLLFFFGDTPDAARHHRFTSETTTNAQGISSLTLQSEMKWALIYPDFKMGCALGEPLDLGHVMSDGVVMNNHCGKPARAAVPGVLVVFIRNATLAEKMAW